MACRRPPREYDRVPFPAGSERAGLLGQGLFLSLTSKPADSSPTARGLFVREQFLCQHVPDPPAGVNTNLPPVTEEKPQTNRDGCPSTRRIKLRHLSPADRSDRVRPGEVRRDWRASREAYVAVRRTASRRDVARRRRKWICRSIPPGPLSASRIRNFPRPRNSGLCLPGARNARSAS